MESSDLVSMESMLALALASELSIGDDMPSGAIGEPSRRELGGGGGGCWGRILIQVLMERHLVLPSRGPMIALKKRRSLMCNMVVRSEKVFIQFNKNNYSILFLLFFFYFIINQSINDTSMCIYVYDKTEKKNHKMTLCVIKEATIKVFLVKYSYKI